MTAIKLGHTLVWVFFVVCILAIPAMTMVARFDLAALFAGLVAAEVVVLALNRMRCPLTALAARYTADRRPNFDIYLPEWLAANNQRIFGALYALAIMFLLLSWLRTN